MKNPSSEVQFENEKRLRKALLKRGWRFTLHGKPIPPKTVKPIVKAPVKTTTAKPTTPPPVSAKLQRQRETRIELMRKYDIR